MIALLLDQGLPLGAAALLRELGWDAVHVSEVGMQEASDEEILAHAEASKRVAVTLDRDFPQLLALTSGSRPSVVFLRRQGVKSNGVAQLIAEVIETHESALKQGCVVTVGTRATRLHRLPLR